ncbi:MAG: hypothetical protein IJG85_07735 [Eubacteriaceae bacterium]|nr:hypothetical protein [Eubacteriaceae bacterium]
MLLFKAGESVISPLAAPDLLKTVLACSKREETIAMDLSRVTAVPSAESGRRG